MKNKNYDFSGYATKNNLRCSDGRTIRKDAFKEMDGEIVPLVWHHRHEDPSNVLGHVLLENRDDGVYAYGTFNDSDAGKNAKLLVEHGDITGLSIYANQLKQNGGDVLHGTIREVSLVLAGANPGAYIDCPVVEHADNETFDAVIYTGLTFDDDMTHADTEEKKDIKKESKQVSDSKEKTVKDVFDEFTEEQKKVVYFLMAEYGKQLGDKDFKPNEKKNENSSEKIEHSDIYGGEIMKTNVFDQSATPKNALSHADMETIFRDGKKCGSLKEAVAEHMESGVLMHDDESTATYGIENIDYLFPDYKSLNVPPEYIKRDTTWVNKVMNAVHHTPFSRIKSVFADITADEARAKGYLKGNLKKDEVFSLLKRTTDPQTVYKRQRMDRDDIIDITDFDVVRWIKSEMRLMLDEEIARAVLIGDGRLSSDDDKISESHVRSIVNDAELYTIKVNINDSTYTKLVAADDTDYSARAKKIRAAAVTGRIDYKGSGEPVLFTTEEELNNFLLADDGFGRPLYPDDAAVARALRVREIITVPVLEDATTDDSEPIVGVIVNMKDYNIGADKGGEVNLFDDFDIDYNQQKYLIETRISGALVKPKSAIVIVDTSSETTSDDADEG